MSFEWLPFTDVLSAIVDNRGRTCPVGASGIPLIATNCIDPSNLYPRYDTTRFVSDETYKTWFRGHPMPGDILFVCKGSPGRTNWVPDPVNFCIAQDMVSVRANTSKIYPKYLFAALRSSVVQAQIDNMHVGTMIPHFKKGDFGKLNIPVPSSFDQKIIGDFYFSISERITILRETNETLEAIAQALFKSWFVDFDPVRAKSEGKLPEGMDEATAALFPDTFEETELGVVPKGWTIGKLSDVVSLRNERIQPSAEVRQMPYVPIESIATKNPFLIDAKSGEEANSSLTLFREGDILFGAMRPYFHKVCVAPFDGVTRTTVFPLKPNSEKERGFGLFCVYQNTTIDFATQNSEGSTIPYAKWKGSLELMGCLIPSKELREEFSKLVGTFIDKANANISTLKTLSNLRDTLLPRLISGQLRIAEAEAELEKVTA